MWMTEVILFIFHICFQLLIVIKAQKMTKKKNQNDQDYKLIYFPKSKYKMTFLVQSEDCFLWLETQCDILMLVAQDMK